MLNVCIINATLLDILQYVCKQYQISINFNIHEQWSLMLSMYRAETHYANISVFIDSIY
jgi:hypothetical protein